MRLEKHAGDDLQAQTHVVARSERKPVLDSSKGRVVKIVSSGALTGSGYVKRCACCVIPPQAKKKKKKEATESLFLFFKEFGLLVISRGNHSDRQ